MKPILFSPQENPKGKILILASEIYPGVCVGGLGKFVAGISDGLRQNSWETAVFVPQNQTPVYLPYYSLQNQIRSRELITEVFRWCQENVWFPSWLWVQDWEGVYQAEEWRQFVPKDSLFSLTKIIWTIHSPISLKGKSGYSEIGYGDFNQEGEEEPIDWGDDFFDFAKIVGRGINTADLVTTVSPTFAKNLSRAPLFVKSEQILGIENGIDKKDWNPRGDDLIDFKLKDNWREFKEVNKQKLQEIFGLPIKNAPVFAFVSRLVPQKGVDLLIRILPKFLAQNQIQLVIVGRGLRKYHCSLQVLKTNFSDQLGLCLKADFTLPHQVFAGADFLLLPSLGEPFGIVVAEARSYGAVPIVRKVDGLTDQVQDGLNGFNFEGDNSDSFLAKLHQALKIWQTSQWWQLSIKGKNRADPWKAVIRKYEPYLLEANKKWDSSGRGFEKTVFFG